MNDYGSGATSADRELYGDLIEDVQRWVAPAIDQRVSDLQRQLGAVQTQLTAERQLRVQQSLDADSQLGSRWRQLNHDGGFLNWLEQRDDLSDRKRLDMLRDAYQSGDASRVKNFFASYLMRQVVPPSQRTAERLPLEQGRPTPMVTERDLVPRKIWRREAIARFYEDVRRGRYAGREVEKLRIEKEITAAARERRIADPPLQNDIK